MQIDLLVSGSGEIGLVAASAFEHDVTAVVFDASEHSITLEFAAVMDSLKLNIPVADDYTAYLKVAPYIHIGVVEKGRITQAGQVPLILVSVDEE